MSNYELILFDLDGTLTDPWTGITNSVAYALDKFDIHIEDKTQLIKFIGPPLVESFAQFYNFSEQQAKQAVEFYREYFAEKGIFENRVYDGVEDLLKSLVLAGKRLCVATSKPEVYAKRILEHFKLSQYFEYIAGATMDETRNQKYDVIEYALKKCNFTDRTKAVMVGDRKHDVLGAKMCSVESVGVLYGYGSRDELQAAGATYIAKTVEDIESLFCKR